MSAPLHYPGASPGDLVGALHDRVHQDTGTSRPAKVGRAMPATPGSEGLYPPESRSLAVRLGRRKLYRSGEPMQTREIPDGKSTFKARATINLADLEQHIAAVRAGNLSESERLAAAVAGVARTEAKP